MSRVTPSRSERGEVRRFGLGILLVAGVLAGGIVAEVVTTDLFIVPHDQTITEDTYVVSTSGTVEGTVDGDLVILTGDLTIDGTVQGNVVALAGGRLFVAPSGVVEGSVRAAAREVDVAGTVEGDVLVTAGMVRIDGSVHRDVIAFAGTTTIAGSVGRDVRGRVVFMHVSGTVGSDVDVTAERLAVAGDARIAGNLLYRSPRGASIAPGASIGGQVVALPTRSNFIFGVFLVLAQLIGALGFVVAGILTFWLFRQSAPRAVAASWTAPRRVLGLGLAVFAGVPVVAGLLSFTLVGIPMALLLVFGMAVGAFVGPVPAVTALGVWLLRGRGGLFGGFLLGAALWLAGVFLLPVVGGLVFLAGLVWGLGSWTTAAWQLRSGHEPDLRLVPSSLVPRAASPGDRPSPATSETPEP